MDVIRELLLIFSFSFFFLGCTSLEKYGKRRLASDQIGIDLNCYQLASQIVVIRPIEDVPHNIKQIIKIRILDFLESMVQAFSVSRYEGKIITMSSGEGQLKVGKRIGAGFWGVVYEVEPVGDLLRHWREVGLEYSNLEARHRRGEKLIIKFPHQFPINLPDWINPWNWALKREYKEFTTVMSLMMNGDRISAAEILMRSKVLSDDVPFLVKPRLNVLTTKEQGRVYPRGMTFEQKESLRIDIFEKYLLLKRQYGIHVDIKPNNIGWDPVKKKYVMYELTLLSSGARDFFGESFNEYLDLYSLSIDRQR